MNEDYEDYYDLRIKENLQVRAVLITRSLFFLVHQVKQSLDEGNPGELRRAVDTLHRATSRELALASDELTKMRNDLGELEARFGRASRVTTDSSEEPEP